MYHPAAMHRTGGAFLLAILVAAIPTVASLCELRCTAHPVAASRTLLPACAGHAARQGGNAPRSSPSDEHNDCARHVLLAKGNGTGIDVQINRAIVAIVRLFGSFVVTPDQKLEQGNLASNDLSPPLSRSSDILRL
jgi:hypothetical protein